MREHMGLYKGKRIDNGEWICGGIFVQEDNDVKEYAVYILTSSLDEVCNAYKIDPNTTCECTGQFDKNGKLIFENDIVVTPKFGTPDRKYIITYDTEIATFIGETKVGCVKHFTTFQDDSECFEIVGNIYDN